MKPVMVGVYARDPDITELRAKAIQQRIEYKIKSYQYQDGMLVEVTNWL